MSFWNEHRLANRSGPDRSNNALEQIADIASKDAELVAHLSALSPEDIQGAYSHMRSANRTQHAEASAKVTALHNRVVASAQAAGVDSAAIIAATPNSPQGTMSFIELVKRYASQKTSMPTINLIRNGRLDTGALQKIGGSGTEPSDSPKQNSPSIQNNVPKVGLPLSNDPLIRPVKANEPQARQAPSQGSNAPSNSTSTPKADAEPSSLGDVVHDASFQEIELSDKAKYLLKEAQKNGVQISIEEENYNGTTRRYLRVQKENGDYYYDRTSLGDNPSSWTLEYILEKNFTKTEKNPNPRGLFIPPMEASNLAEATGIAEHASIVFPEELQRMYNEVRKLGYHLVVQDGSVDLVKKGAHYYGLGVGVRIHGSHDKPGFDFERLEDNIRNVLRKEKDADQTQYAETLADVIPKTEGPYASMELYELGKMNMSPTLKALYREADSLGLHLNYNSFEKKMTITQEGNSLKTTEWESAITELEKIDLNADTYDQDLQEVLQKWISAVKEQKEKGADPIKEGLEYRIKQYKNEVINFTQNQSTVTNSSNAGPLALLPQVNHQKEYIAFLEQNEQLIEQYFGPTTIAALQKQATDSLRNTYTSIKELYRSRELQRNIAKKIQEYDETPESQRHIFDTLVNDIQLLTLVKANDTEAPQWLEKQLQEMETQKKILEVQMGVRDKVVEEILVPEISEQTGIQMLSEYQKEESLSAQASLGSNPEISVKFIPPKYGYITMLEKAVRGTDDISSLWGTNQETITERSFVQNAVRAVEGNLKPIGYFLENATEEVRKTPVYGQLKSLYASRAGRLAELVGNIDTSFESNNLRNADSAKIWTEEALQYMEFEEAFSYVANAMRHIDSNNWQSSSVQETYLQFTGECKSALNSKLLAQKHAAKNDPTKQSAYQANALRVAELFTDRSNVTGIDNNLADPELGSTTLRNAVDFDNAARLHLEKKMQQEFPLLSELSTQRCNAAIDIIPETVRDNPAVAPMIQTLSENPTKVEDIIAKYTVLRTLESLGENKHFNIQQEVKDKTGAFMETALKDFEAYLHNEAPTLAAIHKKIGLPAPTKKMEECFATLSDIEGYGYDIADTTAAGLATAAKVATMIAAGIAVGIATGGAGTPLIVAALAGGAAMTATTAVLFQQGFDTMEDFTKIYGTDFAINTITMGSARYLQAFKIIQQMKIAGTLTPEKAKEIIRVATLGAKGSKAGAMGLNALDDLAAIGSKLGTGGKVLLDLGEGVADMALSSSLEATVRGASFMDTMKENSMFLGLAFARFVNPSMLTRLRSATKGQLDEMSVLTGKMAFISKQLQDMGHSADDIKKIKADPGNPDIDAQTTLLLKAADEIDADMIQIQRNIEAAEQAKIQRAAEKQAKAEEAANAKKAKAEAAEKARAEKAAEKQRKLDEAAQAKKAQEEAANKKQDDANQKLIEEQQKKLKDDSNGANKGKDDAPSPMPKPIDEGENKTQFDHKNRIPDTPRKQDRMPKKVEDAEMNFEINDKVFIQENGREISGKIIGERQGYYKVKLKDGRTKEYLKEPLEQWNTKTPRNEFKPGQEVYVKRKAHKSHAKDSKGVMEKGWFVHKNENGELVIANNKKLSKATEYKSLDPKQTYHIDELENPLNRGNMHFDRAARLIQKRNEHLRQRGDPSITPKLYNKLFGKHFKQGQTGNCYLIAGLDALQHSHHADALLRTAIKKVGKDVYEIRIPLGSKHAQPIRISEAEACAALDWKFVDAAVGQGTHYVHEGRMVQAPRGKGTHVIEKGHQLTSIDGPLGWKLLEAAYIKQKFGTTPVTINGRQIQVPNRAQSEGGFTNVAMSEMFGDAVEQVYIGNGVPGRTLSNLDARTHAQLDDFLDNFSNGREMAGLGSRRQPGGSDKQTYRIPGINYDFHYNHAYSLRSVNQNARTVTIANPHDTSKAITLTYKEFKEAFADVMGVSIDNTKLFDVDMRMADPNLPPIPPLPSPRPIPKPSLN